MILVNVNNIVTSACKKLPFPSYQNKICKNNNNNNSYGVNVFEELKKLFF